MKQLFKIMALLAIIAIFVSVGRTGGNIKRNAFKAEFARREEAKRRGEAITAQLIAESVLLPLTEAFTPMPAGWGSFSVHKAIFPKMSVDRQAGERVVSFENGDIVVSLDYADPPSGEGQPEQDTKKVVGVILDMLRDLGEDPREQWTKVRAFAQKSDAGEVYGESSYDFQEEDLVKWVKYDPERDGPAEKWIETRSE